MHWAASSIKTVLKRTPSLLTNDLSISPPAPMQVLTTTSARVSILVVHFDSTASYRFLASPSCRCNDYSNRLAFPFTFPNLNPSGGGWG